MTLHPQHRRAKTPRDVYVTIPRERQYLFTASTAARILALLERDDVDRRRDAQERRS